VPREDAIKVEGVIVEVLQNTLFRVELTNRHRVLAYVRGRNRMSFVRDRVTVEISPYDLSKGAIVLPSSN
jgi:translation initiation factor IF-1